MELLHTLCLNWALQLGVNSNTVKDHGADLTGDAVFWDLPECFLQLQSQ